MMSNIQQTQVHFRMGQEIKNHLPVNVDQLPQHLGGFTSIYLEDLGKAALMDRQETKYIFHIKLLDKLIRGLESQYRMLEIEGQRICKYRTVYYDTADFQFFQQHQNGSGHRWKIRQRNYLDTNACFWEVKYKDNRKRTRKCRIESDLNLDQIPDSKSPLIKANLPFSQDELFPSLEIRYTRITLVKNDGLERITLDNQITYSRGRISSTLEGLAIAEIKQATFNPSSPFMVQIKNAGIRSSPFSKYCIGISLLYPDIKHNRFKPILHHVSKVLEGGYSSEWSQ